MATSRSYVYVAENLKNSKKYIGVSQRPYDRWRSHLRNAERGQRGVLYSALRKYGQLFFDFRIIERCKSHDEALQREIHWIRKLSPEYNQTEGGEGAKGYKHTEDTLKSLSVNHNSWNPVPPMFGKNHSLETRQKISRAKKKYPQRYWLGRQRSQETKDKIRETKIGVKRVAPVSDLERETRANNMRRAAAARVKKIVCLNDGKVFPSWKEVGVAYGVTRWFIYHSCYSRLLKKSLQFRYLEG